MLGLSCLLVTARPAFGQGEFVEMLWKVPKSANAIALIKAEELFDTPIGLREGWAEAASAAGGPPAAVTPDARYALFATRMDLVNGFTPLWRLGLAALKGPADPEAIANADGGAVDDASDPVLIWSPRDLFYVPFKPDLIGIIAPANRQSAIRWVRESSRQSEPVVSEFLQDVARTIQGSEAQYILGIDMEGLSSTNQLKPHVARLACVDLKLDDVEAIAESLASIRGLTMELTADAEIHGRLRIEFTKSTAPLKRIAKPLILEVLGRLGAEVTAIKRDWSILVEDKAISYRGSLSPQGARRVASLVELPTSGVGAAVTMAAAPDEAAEDAPSPGSVNVRATRAHFQAIQNLLDDLTEKAVDQRRVSLWCQRYADKIDRMPLLGVDPELLDFGQQVSMTLRNLANVSTGASLNVNMRRTTEAANTYTYGGYYGYGYTADLGDTSRAAMSRITRQEATKAAADEISIWTKLENQTAAMRRKLTERYGVEF